MKKLKINSIYLFLFLPILLAQEGAPHVITKPFNQNLSTNVSSKTRKFTWKMGLQEIDITYLMQIIITIIIMLLATLFLGLIFYGGYKWMMAKGNENEVEEARGIIRHAIIGLIVTLSSYALGYFILFYLLTGGGGTGAPLGTS